ESVLTAISQIMSKIAELSGAISGGDHNAEAGSARMKIVVPYQAASSLIGPGGQRIKELRDRSGMHVHIEELTVPPGKPHELTEQVVSINGNIEGAKVFVSFQRANPKAAISMIADTVGRYSSEPWFEAWAFNSHCGLDFPGLSLFARERGKGKDGERKGKGKGRDFGGDLDFSPKGWAKGSVRVLCLLGRITVFVFDDRAGGGYASGPPAQMTVKMLVSIEEVGILGQDPTIMQKVQQETGTTGMLSESSYPGTALQELTVQGPNAEAVLTAVSAIISRITDVMGTLSSGELNVPPGDVRIKLVIPKRAAAALIGPGGQQVKHIKASTGIRISIDEHSMACGDPSVMEEAVCLIGPANSAKPALEAVVRETANCLSEPWFSAWANHSNAGKHVPGLVLFEAVARGNSFGGGKGKGKFGEGKYGGGSY
ncbi:unnamed protein product, partial [Polarella glacialis]